MQQKQTSFYISDSWEKKQSKEKRTKSIKLNNQTDQNQTLKKTLKYFFFWFEKSKTLVFNSFQVEN